MIAAIRYRINEAGQTEYVSSGVNNGDDKEFTKKVEQWNNTHEDKYKVYDDPLVVCLAMKLQEAKEKNDGGRLADAIDTIKETLDEMMQDLDGLSSCVSDVKTFLASQEEVE